MAGGKEYVTRENDSSAEEQERTEEGTKLRPAGPKNSEDDRSPSMQTEGEERKAKNLCDEAKGLPGRAKVLETKPESLEGKMGTLVKEDQAEKNSTRSLLGGTKSFHGNSNIRSGSKTSAKEKNGRDHDEGDNFRGGNQTSPGRRQGGETIIHGDNEDLHVEEREGSKPKGKMSFREGTKALGDDLVSRVEKGETLANGGRSQRSLTDNKTSLRSNVRVVDTDSSNHEEWNNFLEGTKALGDDPVSWVGKGETLANGERSQRSLTDNKTSLRSNVRVVDTDSSNHDEWKDFRGGKKALETQSNDTEEESKAFINKTNVIEQGTEIVHGDISHPARGRDVSRKKAAPAGYKRRHLKKNGDAICKRYEPWRIPGFKNALTLLLLFQQFVSSASAGSPSNSTNGSHVYRFCCSNLTNLTNDHLIFRARPKNSAVCEYTAGKVSNCADNIYKVFLQNDTCAIMETSDSEVKLYFMEHGVGDKCPSKLYDLPKVLNSYQMINLTNNNVTNPIDSDDSGAFPPWAIGLCIGLLGVVVLVVFGICYFKKSRMNSTSDRNGVGLRYSPVTRNGCTTTPVDGDTSRMETANGV